MTIECIGGTGEQWILFYNQAGQYVSSTIAPYEGVARVGSVKCGTLMIDTSTAVAFPFEAYTALPGVTNASVGYRPMDANLPAPLPEPSLVHVFGVLVLAIGIRSLWRNRHVR